MDLWEFMTALLYEYDFFYCVCTFTLLLCFWDMQIWLVTRYIVLCAVCFTVAIIWHLYQRAQDRLCEQHELDNVPPLTDRLIQRTIKEQWDQLMINYRSADLRKVILHPETGMRILNRHARVMCIILIPSLIYRFILPGIFYPGLSPMPKYFDLALGEGNNTFILWARNRGTLRAS